MVKTIKIRRGLDIPVAGAASAQCVELSPASVGVVPDDFPGYKWRPVVKPGDRVVIGSPIFQAKEADDICLVSHVVGTVREIRRGERRHIEALVIDRDNDDFECINFEIPDLSLRRDTRALLKNSGLWARMRQRPYGIVPEAESQPRDIFVTAFDSAPLAPALCAGLDRQDIAKGVEVLASLTDGRVHIGCRPEDAEALSLAANHHAVITAFVGPHPAGNVGPQIAAIAPVAKGDTVWTLDIRTLAAIGYLFNTNALDCSASVAVTGPEVENPHMVKTVEGCPISEILALFNMADDPGRRIVSGNLLTGDSVAFASGFLRFPYRQICVIQEGDHVDEFMGWASMSPSKFSVKRMLPSGLFRPKRNYNFDSRLLGGRRAMILTGELDRVFPFDIYPEFLLKAIMAFDIDKMEGLGIYEVAPVDFALPEFVDTSKEPLQKIVRDGLQRLRAEL